MTFADFIKSGKVRKGAPDVQLAKSLVKMSENHMKTVGEMKLSQTSSATIMANCYESLREIVEAMAAKEGYKVYSHEAFTHFLKEKGEEMLSAKFDKYRKIRNGINYYGEPVEAQVTRAGKSEIEKMIIELKRKFLSGF